MVKSINYAKLMHGGCMYEIYIIIPKSLTTHTIITLFNAIKKANCPKASNFNNNNNNKVITRKN